MRRREEHEGHAEQQIGDGHLADGLQPGLAVQRIEFFKLLAGLGGHGAKGSAQAAGKAPGQVPPIGPVPQAAAQKHPWTI